MMTARQALLVAFAAFVLGAIVGVIGKGFGIF
jgi:hypothetical protein